VTVSHAVGLLPMAPAGAVAPGAVPLHTGSAVLLSVLAAVVVLGLVLLGAKGGMRALAGRGEPSGGVRALAGRGEPSVAVRRPRGTGARTPVTAGDPGMPVAILLWSCLLVLVVWGGDPFAALLLVPALHLWLGALVPDAGIRPSVRVALLALGFVLPALLFLYYALALGYGPVSLAWTLALMVAGGQISVLAAVLMCLLAGCGVCATVSALGSATVRGRMPAEAPITVRGPVTYAGPGSLGGTSSALPRPGSSRRGAPWPTHRSGASRE
jgi:hypothetical protein